MPRSVHNPLISVSGHARASCAAKIFSGVKEYRRPPRRPCLRAASRPSRVRSEILSRSNSASDSNTAYTRRPDRSVVSISFAPNNTRRPTSRSSRMRTVLIRWRRLRPRRSSLLITKVSPSRKCLETPVERRSLVVCSQDAITENALNVHTDTHQCVHLRAKRVLRIACANSRIAD